MKPGRIRSMLTGVCEIIDGLTTILTIGSYRPNLAWKFLTWAELKYLNHLQSLQEK